MFAALHPAVLLLYYSGVLSLLLFVSQPAFSLLACLGAAALLLLLQGKRGIKALAFAAVMLLMTAAANLLFNHMGLTVLFTLFSMDLTLESLYYGLSQGVLFAALLLWFTVLSYTADSEKLLYLFRFTPKTALIFSMVLGFIPRFSKKSRDIREARIALNAPPKGKLKAAVADFSALVNYALESSMITALAMEARGYRSGVITRRRYHMRAFDILFFTVTAVTIAAVIILRLQGAYMTVFEPTFGMKATAPGMLCGALLMLFPAAVTLWEEIRWKQLSVKA